MSELQLLVRLGKGIIRRSPQLAEDTARGVRFISRQAPDVFEMVSHPKQLASQSVEFLGQKIPEGAIEPLKFTADSFDLVKRGLDIKQGLEKALPQVNVDQLRTSIGTQVHQVTDPVTPHLTTLQQNLPFHNMAEFTQFLGQHAPSFLHLS